jgi:predicted DNA-binding helix-hairpin-helix protein
LSRAYFSSFRPLPIRRLEHLPPSDRRREHRLYQTSFLFRDYGFDLEDLPFEPTGNLPLEIDPKLAWAQSHLRENPVELNRPVVRSFCACPGLARRARPSF